MNAEIKLAEINSLLPDNLFDSKDWKAGGTFERVEWLLEMYKSAKEERDEYLNQLDSLIKK